MGAMRSRPAEDEDTQVPSGRTRWWVVALILGLPALLVVGFLVMVAIWVLADDSSESEQRPPRAAQVSVQAASAASAM